MISETSNFSSLNPSIQEIMRANMKGQEYYLYVKGDKALYTTDQLKEQLVHDSNTVDGEGNVYKERIFNQPYSEIIFTDKGKDFRQSQITTQGKSYNISESLGQNTWVLKDESKTIDNFKCFLAETTLYGQKIRAWYSNEIPLNFGPSRFHNLPGLMLRLEMGKRIITATKITYSDVPVVEPPEGGTIMSRKMFDTLIMKQMNTPEGTETDQNGDTATKKTVIKF